MKLKNEIVELNETLESVYEACVYRKEMKNPNAVLDYIQKKVEKTRNKLMD